MRTKTLAMAAFVTVVAIGATSHAWCADTTDAEQTKQQLLLLPSAQQAVASAAGYEARNIEIKSTVHQVTITVINSKLNTRVAADRDAEASKLVSIFALAIGEKPAFAQVMVVHVDYVQRPASSTKAIQRFDFYRSPAGLFVAHYNDT